MKAKARNLRLNCLKQLEIKLKGQSFRIGKMENFMRKILQSLFIIALFFSLNIFVFTQIEQSQPTDKKKVAVVYSDKFGDEEFGIREFVVAIKKVENEIKDDLENYSLKAKELNEAVKYIMTHNGLCLTEEGSKKVRNAIEKYLKLEIEVKDLQTKLKEKVELLNKKYVEETRTKIREKLESFTKQQGFIMIIDLSVDETVLIEQLNENSIDVTEQFIKYYNESTKSMEK